MTPRMLRLFEKAERALASARRELAAGAAETVINRAYYAAFYAATAALLSLEETPRSHAGVHNRFYLRFVEKGHIDQQIGKALKRAYDLRQGADYDLDVVFAPAVAAQLLEEVERFVSEVEVLLQSDGH